jgi:hypothetical protein
VGEGTELG